MFLWILERVSYFFGLEGYGNKEYIVEDVWKKELLNYKSYEVYLCISC